jgi:translation initiation factor 2B subunit (eIF-2B alpha/beta/delta family)
MSQPKLSVQMVKPKNLLLQIQNSSDLEAYILDSLKGIELSLHKFNPDLILYICNVVENWFYKYKKSVADEKLNKKDIVIKIIKKLIPSINSIDEQSIIQIIEHLHSSKKIKVVSLLKWTGKILCDLLQKKD